MSPNEARMLAVRVAVAARADQPDEWSSGMEELSLLDGREWLQLDRAARWFRYADGAPVSGVKGWLGPQLEEPSGFVTAVTSLHVDGRVRERATRALALASGPVAASALAVRLLDHVPNVRAQAWRSLRSRLGQEIAEPVLDVLLAGRERRQGASELDQVVQRLREVVPEEGLLDGLQNTGRRGVRRWAFETAHERGLLTTEALLRAAQSDPDQWVQATCANWLMSEPDTSRLAPLVTSTSAEARIVALTRVEDLDPASLERLLLDKSPRVREQARWRARRREVDLAAFYRVRLRDDSAPRSIAACLEGLAEVGDESDRDAFVAGLQHTSARVRSAAVTAVAGHASTDAVVTLLRRILLDQSPRVAMSAARALARAGVGSSASADAWMSERVGNRRAAWRLVRAAGGWDRVTADLCHVPGSVEALN